MLTLSEVIEAHGVEVLDHLDRSDPVPVLHGIQAQGDLLVIPITGEVAGEPVPAQGIELIRGEAGANAHTLLGEATFLLGGPNRLSLAQVQVTGTAFLAHPEHGYLGLGAGTYEVRRQRELAEEERRIAD